MIKITFGIVLLIRDEFRIIASTRRIPLSKIDPPIDHYYLTGFQTVVLFPVVFRG